MRGDAIKRFATGREAIVESAEFAERVMSEVERTAAFLFPSWHAVFRTAGITFPSRTLLKHGFVIGEP